MARCPGGTAAPSEHGPAHASNRLSRSPAADVKLVDVLPPNSQLLDGSLTASFPKIASGSTVSHSYVIVFTSGGSMEVAFLSPATVTYKAEEDGDAQVSGWGDGARPGRRHVDHARSAALSVRSRVPVHADGPQLQGRRLCAHPRAADHPLRAPRGACVVGGHGSRLVEEGRSVGSCARQQLISASHCSADVGTAADDLLLLTPAQGTYASLGICRTPAHWRNMGILLVVVATLLGANWSVKSVSHRSSSRARDKALKELQKDE